VSEWLHCSLHVYEDFNHNVEEIEMSARKVSATGQACEIGDKLGIEWNRFDTDQSCRDLNAGLEHGLRGPSTDVTGNAEIITGKIALAHLNEFADCCTRLNAMEREAKAEEGQY